MAIRSTATKSSMAACACGAAAAAGGGEYPFVLGDYSCPVTTALDSEGADALSLQAWFDKGMSWAAGLHREEGIVCFERALELDPSCAMAHWAIAFCHGPHYNMNGDRYVGLSRQADGFPSMPTAFAHAQQAKAALTDGCSGTETALINALLARYVEELPANDTDGNVVLTTNAAMDRLNRAFVSACREAAHAAPDDAELAWCLTEALMNCRPWQLWDVNTGEQAPETPEIVETLTRGLALSPRHPALCHLAIHCCELHKQPPPRSNMFF